LLQELIRWTKAVEFVQMKERYWASGIRAFGHVYSIVLKELFKLRRPWALGLRPWGRFFALLGRMTDKSIA
jgi:hypothetical protein